MSQEKSIINCKFCGKETSNDTKFCPQCSKEFEIPKKEEPAIQKRELANLFPLPPVSDQDKNKKMLWTNNPLIEPPKKGEIDLKSHKRYWKIPKWQIMLLFLLLVVGICLITYAISNMPGTMITIDGDTFDSSSLILGLGITALFCSLCIICSNMPGGGGSVYEGGDIDDFDFDD